MKVGQYVRGMRGNLYALTVLNSGSSKRELACEELYSEYLVMHFTLVGFLGTLRGDGRAVSSQSGRIHAAVRDRRGLR